MDDKGNSHQEPPRELFCRYTDFPNSATITIPITYKDGRGYFSIHDLLPGRIQLDFLGHPYKLETTLDSGHRHAKVTFDVSQPPQPAPSREKRTVRFRFSTSDGGTPSGTLVVRPAEPAEPNRGSVALPIARGEAVGEFDTPQTIRYLPNRLSGYYFDEGEVLIEKGKGPLDVAIRLTPAGSISGEILTAGGSPEKGCLFKASDGPRRSRWNCRLPELTFEASADGRFLCNPLPLGHEYVVLAGKRSAVAVSEPVKLDGAHPTRTLTLRFQPTRSVSGTVVDASGREAPGASVTVVYQNPFTLEEWWNWPETTVDARGRFTLDGIGRGVEGYCLVAWGTSAKCPITVIPLPPEGQRVTIQLKAGKPLKGQLVRKKTGRPIVRASVTAYAESVRGLLFDSSQATTDENGHFEFSDLMDRPYKLSAADEEAAESGEIVAQPGDKVVRIEVDGKSGR